MNTLREEAVYNCPDKRAKTGFLSQNRIMKLLHIDNTATQVVSPVSFGTAKFAYREEDTSRLKAEAELRKAQAQTYASTMPFR